MSQPTPLPYKQLAVLAIINLNEAIQMNLIWPFIPFMVKDFIGADNPQLGIYVGILASTFYIAQFASGALWGWLSDRYGRRPTLLWGLLGTVASMVLLGLSESYGVAVLARAMGGFLNGNVGIAKTYLADITDSTNQAAGFSILLLMWGIGATTAPSIGGFLSDPASNYSGFDTEFWRRFPYFLPNLASCFSGVLGCTLGYFMLPETTGWIRRNEKRKAELQRKAKSQGLMESGSQSAAFLSDDDGGQNGQGAVHGGGSRNGYRKVSVDLSLPSQQQQDPQGPYGSMEQSFAQPKSFIRSPSDSVVYRGPKRPAKREHGEYIGLLGAGAKGVILLPRHEDGLTDENEDKDDAESSQVYEYEPELLRTRSQYEFQHNTSKLVKSASIVALITHDDTDAPPPDPSEKKKPTTLLEKLIPPIARDFGVLMVVGTYGGIAFMAIMFDEILPLFCQEKIENGGMGWSSSQIGILGSAAGVFVLLYQGLIYPHIIKRLGSIRSLLYVLFVGVPYFLFFPVLARVAESPPGVMWTLMILYHIPKVVIYSTMFTSIIMMVSNSAKPSQRGAVNGLAQSMASLVRAIGPLIAGAIWTWSVDLRSFSLHNHIPYAIIAATNALNIFLSWYLPVSLNKPQTDVMAMGE